MTEKQFVKYIENQLLACPFCGGKPSFVQWRDMDNCAFVTCRKCGSKTMSRYGRDHIRPAVHAKVAWNKRAI